MGAGAFSAKLENKPIVNTAVSSRVIFFYDRTIH